MRRCPTVYALSVMTIGREPLCAYSVAADSPLRLTTGRIRGPHLSRQLAAVRSSAGRWRCLEGAFRYGIAPRKWHDGAVRLTVHADYALRVLMYLAVAPGRRASAREIAEAFHVSQHHMSKVAQRLVRTGMVTSSSGRNGGLELAVEPREITLGAIVRAAEDDMAIVECLGHTRYCRVAGVCGARSIFSDAVDAFMATLDGQTLETVLRNREGVRGALGLR
jgi:Rrf2 family transcriptional regulator, nitric oxide-sensitive transcriptional repressor